MRTVTFQSVLWGAARKAGLSPETDGLDLPIAAQLTEGINDAIKLAWEYYNWPELTRTLSFTPQAHPTATDTLYLPYVDSYGGDRFGTVLSLWTTDPRLPRACRVPYELLDDGVYLPTDAPATIWMQCRDPHPVFNHAVQTARNYLPGEVVYLPSTGECYILPTTPIEWLLNAGLVAEEYSWDMSGDMTWRLNDGSAVLGVDADNVPIPTGGSGFALITQTVANLPAGSYALSFELSDMLAESGASDLSITVEAAGDVLQIYTTAPGQVTLTFTHAGGNCAINFFAEWTGDGEIYASFGLLSLIINPAGITRTAPALPWQRIPFPRWLATACKHGAAAALDRTEGQGGSAASLEAIMIEWLEHEIDQIGLQQRQPKRYSR